MNKKVVNRFFVACCIVTASMSVNLVANAALPFFSTDKGEVPSLAPMLDKATPAIVSISVEGTQVSRQRVPEMFRHFFGVTDEQIQERPFKGLGSGVIIDAKKGYVVTNNHVVDNADEIIVKLTDGREFTAKKLGADEQSDIALLKIEPDALSAMPLADSDELRVGDFVVAIGNPFGLNQTVTSGIVSALGRSGLNIGGYENFIQTDAAINRGNSGGALVSLRGELVGINTAIFGPNGGNVGIGFAIPSNMMKSLVDQIIKFGEVRRGLLGIVGSDIDSGLADAMNLDVNQGAFVSEVTPDSAAITTEMSLLLPPRLHQSMQLVLSASVAPVAAVAHALFMTAATTSPFRCAFTGSNSLTTMTSSKDRLVFTCSLLAHVTPAHQHRQPGCMSAVVETDRLAALPHNSLGVWTGCLARCRQW